MNLITAILLPGLVAVTLVAAPVQQEVSLKYLKAAGSRTFSVEYVGKILDVPDGARNLRIWLPVPQNSSVQSIRNLSFSANPTLTKESKYGNKIAYFEIDSPGSKHEITMRFTCVRKEVLIDLEMLQSERPTADSASGPFLQPDKLFIIDDGIREIARTITAGKTTTVDKARAIHDFVLKQMTYDKNHSGWGLGSTRHACEVGKGNCTDFHALFNSLCRAEGIASGFEIGLYLPYERNSAEPLGGYHCWAFFNVRGKTWVPVDCSEADRFPARKEYFFGGHTPNRVTLSTGRDIILEPKQDGEPLNYFLNPYAEADGKPVKTEKFWSYRDL